jgi:hypothetical protein
MTLMPIRTHIWDLLFSLMRIQIRLFTLKWIWILLLIKVMLGLQFGYRVRGLPWLHFVPLELLNFEFNADGSNFSLPGGSGFGFPK